MIDKIDGKLEKWYLELVFFISGLAVTGSLYTSQVLGWEICGICWFQRVFMYPLPILAGIGVFLEKNDLRNVVLPLSIPGALLSLYHHVSVAFDPTQTCGFILPCSFGSRLYFGVSLQPRFLPLMSFLAFTAVSLIIWRYEM